MPILLLSALSMIYAENAYPSLYNLETQIILIEIFHSNAQLNDYDICLLLSL
jgi:hypothetical protein